MAEKIKYTKRDLKGPDEFISVFSRGVTWGKENVRKIAIGAGAVVILIAAVVGTQGYFRWQERRATQDLWPHLNRAREFLQAPTAADADKVARLEQFLVAYVGMHPNANATVYARYYLGSIAGMRGNYAASASHFRAAIDQRKDKGLISFLLRTGLAQALESKGDYPGAMEAYRDAASVSTNEMREQAVEGEARMLAALGKKKDAEALYRSILTGNPESPLKNIIELRLQQLT